MFGAQKGNRTSLLAELPTQDSVSTVPPPGHATHLHSQGLHPTHALYFNEYRREFSFADVDVDCYSGD